MKKQRGLGGIEIVIILAVVGIVLGAWAYHESTIAGFKQEIKNLNVTISAKNDTINKQSADIGTLTAKIAALEVANKNFADLAQAQNNSIKNIRAERDDMKEKWQAAMALAAAHATQNQQLVDKIMTTQLKPGQNWCDAYMDLLNAYIKERKAGRAK